MTLPSVVFLVAVDNMLLDNDRVAADLRRHLERQPGRERQERYRAIFEQLRSQLGDADYLGALQRYRLEFPREPHVLTFSSILVNYPFASRLYPNSLDVLERFGAWGPTVIFPMATPYFSRARWSARGFRKWWIPTSSSISIRSASWMMWSCAGRPSTTC